MSRAWVGVVVMAVACSHAPKPAPAPQAQHESAPPPSSARDNSDEMSVQGTLGSLSDEEIGGPFERRWDEVSRCFADAKAKSKLWYLAGKVELKIRVGQDGKPKTVFVSSSTVGHYDAERCILNIARELSFSRPRGGSEAEFTYPIEFRGKAAVMPWDAARVETAMARHRTDVRACKKGAALPPSVMMTVYVAPGGKVTSAGFHADAPLDDTFAMCLVEKCRTWRMDDPLGRIAKATVGVGTID